jgi:hypothetical protein
MAKSALERALGRLADRLRQQLGRLRQRGRSPAADRLGGLVIEPGEPALILDEITNDLAWEPTVAAPPLAADVPAFAHAQRVYGLSDHERDALLVALAPEVDARFARLFGYLNDSVVSFRPTVGLIAVLVAPGASPASVLASFSPGAPLARYALLGTSGGGSPLAAQAVVVPSTFWPFLAELPGAEPRSERPGLALDALVVPPALSADAERVAAWWRARPDGMVVVEGPVGAGRETLAAALVAARGDAIVRFAARDGAWPSVAEILRGVRWHEGVGLLVEPSPAVVAELAETNAPLALVSEHGSTLAAAATRRQVAVVRTTAFSGASRLALWRRALPEVGLDELAPVAARFRIGPGRIAEVARRAADQVGPTPVTAADLTRAVLEASALRLDGLAGRVEVTGAPHLVAPAATRRELETATSWAARRRDVLSREGDGARLDLAAGLVCLFWGPPGTGKTLAARRIAALAGVDLYRVDLAQVVSKYIGETEKQLAAVLDECERSDVALLFDEADALFGKRTAVKDAHDRYANIETGFLLQRLETTSALVILTSNLRENLDDAFTRRLHIVAEFPAPARPEREALWRHLLPPRWRDAPAIDVGFLARFELRGGDIRNAIATALVTVDDDGPERLMHFLVWGVWRELVKAGRLVAAADFGPWEQLALRLGRGEGPGADRAVGRVSR